MKQTKTQNKSRAMEIYQPNELPVRRGNTQLARRGNTDLARRGDYSIVPAEDYDLEVVEGKVSLYRPEVVKQAEPKKERKPFDLVNTVKWLLAWTMVGVVVFGFLVFKTMPQGLEQMAGMLGWINNACMKITGTLLLATLFEMFLLGFLTDLFGGGNK